MHVLAALFSESAWVDEFQGAKHPHLNLTTLLALLTWGKELLLFRESQSTSTFLAEGRGKTSLAFPSVNEMGKKCSPVFPASLNTCCCDFSLSPKLHLPLFSNFSRPFHWPLAWQSMELSHDELLYVVWSHPSPLWVSGCVPAISREANSLMRGQLWEQELESVCTGCVAKLGPQHGSLHMQSFLLSLSSLLLWKKTSVCACMHMCGLMAMRLN